MDADFSKLKRPQYAMPDFVAEALKARGLMDAYKERPAYQQNTILAGSSGPSSRKQKRNGYTKCSMNLKRAVFI
ncbi:MAG: hypothetical protein R3A44_38850 [Caldilineaceae bacterium]